MPKRVLEAVRDWWGKRIATGPEEAASNAISRQGGLDVDSRDLAALAARWPAPARSLLGSVEDSTPRHEQIAAGSQRKECCTPGIGKQ